MSPVVITLKRSSNEIRLNVDMREANKANPRTHTVMPTLDDIINELNGATVFSHFDMNHGYHQLVLKENSRDIATFATHVGLYRYKRLNFGTRFRWGDIPGNRPKRNHSRHSGMHQHQ